MSGPSIFLFAAAVSNSPALDDFYSDYRDQVALRSHLEQLATDHPELVHVHDLGASVEGRELVALELRGTSNEDAPVGLQLGTQHAREWISAMVVTYLADRLADDYGHDPAATYILDRLRMVFVPLVNPDGYAHSWGGDRLWRKNRGFPEGIDLNRNWGTGWSPSTNTQSETYPGTEPFSEPETAALHAFATRESIVGVMDWHSFGGYILCPFSDGSTPHHVDEHVAWSEDMALAFATAGGGELTPCAPARRVGNGMALDWFAEGSADHAPAMAWLLELPGVNFDPPAATILPTARSSYAAMLAGMRRVAERFGDSDDMDSSTSTDSGTEGDATTQDSDAETSDDETSDDATSDGGDSSSGATSPTGDGTTHDDPSTSMGTSDGSTTVDTTSTGHDTHDPGTSDESTNSGSTWTTDVGTESGTTDDSLLTTGLGESGEESSSNATGSSPTGGAGWGSGPSTPSEGDGHSSSESGAAPPTTERGCRQGSSLSRRVRSRSWILGMLGLRRRTRVHEPTPGRHH